MGFVQDFGILITHIGFQFLLDVYNMINGRGHRNENRISSIWQNSA